MEQLDQISTLIALSMGVAWASGINLYATVLMLGVLNNMGHISLPPGLEIVSDPLVLIAAGFMYCVEFSLTKHRGLIRAGTPCIPLFASLQELLWRREPWVI